MTLLQLISYGSIQIANLIYAKNLEYHKKIYFQGNLHKSWVVATCEATFLLNVINYLHTDKLLWTCIVAIGKYIMSGRFLDGNFWY